MAIETLSAELSNLVETSGASVVRVEGRRRAPSSGVVWSSEGVIVASHHAVEADEDVPVGLPDGRTVAGSVVGRDPGCDLAVLRCAVTGLEPARWAEDEAVKLGQLVVGLSRPGRALRAQLGIMAAVAEAWRSPAGGRLERYLETDLRLHPGFSGGLLTGVGGALGISTAGLLRGASLVVPAASVRRIAETVLAHGRVRRGFLGIGTQPIALAEDLRARTGQGSALIVLSVQPDGPAARAGLLLGDVLLRAGDEPLVHTGALLPALDEDRVGKETTFQLLRAGEVRTVSIVIGERVA